MGHLSNRRVELQTVVSPQEGGKVPSMYCPQLNRILTVFLPPALAEEVIFPVTSMFVSACTLQADVVVGVVFCCAPVV